MLSVNAQREQYLAFEALGEKAILSEFSIVLDDAPDTTLLFKEFPIPIITPEDVIEIPMVGGGKSFTSQQARTHFRGSCTLIDTVDGAAKKLVESFAMERGVNYRRSFDFMWYHGTPENHTQSGRCHGGIFFGFDPIQADSESNSQGVQWAGQIAYHYFGESK